MLLNVMAHHLAELGFAVTALESGNAAIARLEAHDFDAILIDWYMPDGSGADLFRWIATFRPWLVDRCIFLSAGSPEDVAEVAPGRPVVPKGQDSDQLVTVLMHVARRGRRASEPPPTTG
jgi:CheY-like chemotaxis protein